MRENFNMIFVYFRNLKKSETNAIRNKVLAIITDNSKKNIARLNSSITELFSMDETFKRDISTAR